MVLNLSSSHFYRKLINTNPVFKIAFSNFRFTDNRIESITPFHFHSNTSLSPSSTQKIPKAPEAAEISSNGASSRQTQTKITLQPISDSSLLHLLLILISSRRQRIRRTTFSTTVGLQNLILLQRNQEQPETRRKETTPQSSNLSRRFSRYPA